MSRILFLEDNALLAESVVEELEKAGYDVVWAQEGEEAAEAAYARGFGLYLLDVNVPGIDGFDLLRGLRESGDDTPALFLTSRNRAEDLEKGFGAGADDYVKKPFDLAELLIRIKARVRGKELVRLSPRLALDPVNLAVHCGEEVRQLRAKEFAVLELLCRHRGQLLETDEMIHALYPDEPISLATFRTYVKTIKRHIHGFARLENVKGVGYRITVL